MKFRKTKIKDLYTSELEAFIDERGIFVRSYCSDILKEIGVTKSIKQINHSLTHEVGTVRGMHYQLNPYSEIKIIRCISGEVFDVAIDLRRGSNTFLDWHGEYLSSDKFNMMVIPEGFAHGFQVLKPNSELLYFHTENYNQNVEAGILYNDQKIGIKWPIKITKVSDRDLSHKCITKEFKGVYTK